MADETANLELPYILSSQAQKHVTHNEALQILDSVVQLAVLSASVTAPPGAPSEGQRWIVPAGATGAWAGQTNKIAAWQDGAWLFITPRQGWSAYNIATTTLLAFNGAAWVNALSVSFADITMLGINTAADATNRLAVKANAALLSHDDVTPGSGDMRVTLNKSAAAKDAGFTFQDGFSTRALFGLLADDNFTVKVSPDGAAFSTGLSIRKEDGHVGLAGYAADNSNDLGVKATNILFDKRTDHIRALFNKAAAANDASFGFETNFSTRALLGLLGNDNFSIKVSPDGSTFKTAMVIDRSTGVVTMPLTSGILAAEGTTGTSMPNSTYTDQVWDTTTRNDFGAAWNGTTFTAPQAGIYDISAVLSCNGSPTQADMYFNKNGSVQLGFMKITNGTAQNTVLSRVVVALAAGDTISARMRQNSGTAQTGLSAAVFSIMKVG